MTETEIDAIIQGHRNRNDELLRNLSTKGVGLHIQRPIEHHFWAQTHREATLLAKELYDRGYLVLVISPVTEEGSTCWNIEAEVEQTPSIAASWQVTNELTRLAARFDSIYDGWGTII